MEQRSVSVSTATALVVASMIGVGVFTSAGYQAADLQSAPAILFAWTLGGLTACCGALTYAELATALPRNGGEVSILGRAYHPAVGTAAGLVSLLAGFAAPLAASAIAFEGYLTAALPIRLPGSLPAALLVVVASAGQLTRGSQALQQLLTAAKVLLVIGLIVAGALAGDPSRWTAATRPFDEAVLSPAFAIGLVYVSYAYTGWNAAAYVAGDVSDPARDLPRALVGGTVAVTVLYLGVHLALLALAPLEVLAGKVEVADAAVRHGIGPKAATGLSLVIAFGLWSTASAYATTGAATAVATLHQLGWQVSRATCTAALAGLALGLIAIAGFESILRFVGVTLGCFSLLAVLGVFVLRWREPELLRPYRTWGYPVTPLVYAVLALWMIVYVCWDDPVVGPVTLGVLTGSVGVGALLSRR